MGDLKRIKKLKSLCKFSYVLKNDYCESISFYDKSNIFENTIRRNSSKEEIIKIISDFPYLRYVNLRKSRVSFFPNFISKKIEYLDLSCNNISEVTHDNLDLPKLKFLNLGSNFIQRLPDLSNLPLETLKIHKNPIKEFPIISKNIKNLNLFINQLKEIPKIIFELLDLEIFSFGMTNIKKIPNFSILKKIRWLVLACNQIKTVPDSLCNCENLEGLILAKNNITKLPDEFGKLKKLHTLSLYKNQIKSLPKSFQDLNLSKFSIKDNPLKLKVRK